MTKATIVKKYGNRRLYDTAGSRYVNLEDVARMIREGSEVQVRDAISGKDLTRVILTQIIMEDARGPDTGLPLELLRQLVAASDRATHDFLSWYVKTTMEMYEKARDAFRAGVASPLDFIRHLLPASSDELQQLRRRVQELEQRLAESGESQRRPRGRKKTDTTGGNSRYNSGQAT